MKNFGYAILGATCAFLLACSDSDSSGASTEGGEVSITDKTISGVSQKGPFVKGSSVTVYELGAQSLSQTGKSYDGKIKNERGEFTVEVEKLGSPYALLKADGYYRNEITGEKSNGTVTLYAMTDLSNRSEVNVNLLTHLEYERSLYLVKNEKMSVAEAKKQAEKEVLESFGIEGDFENSENLNIFGDDAGSAALLAISVLMQGNLKEADFTERLNDYASDIEDDGKWDDKKTATLIADWAASLSLSSSLGKIRKNITDWELSSSVPAFEKFIDEYWWRNYGLDKCTDKREGEILQNSNAQSQANNVYFVCKENSWRVATALEYDTYEKKCDEDGKIVFGNVNKDQPYDCDGNSWRAATEVEGKLGGCIEKRFDEVAEALETHYICENRGWRVATDLEKDTYTWKEGKDADVKTGDIVKSNCYVYEGSSWRDGKNKDCTLELRGCTQKRQDTVGLGKDKVWYICDDKNWRYATTYEKDTFGWKDSTDGAVKKGNVTDSIYVFDKTKWRATSNVEAKLGGCVVAISDSVGKVGETYYICKSNKWGEASAIEYDTYRWTAGKDGDSKVGSVNAGNCYVFENNVWRIGNLSDCSLGLRGCTTLRQDTVGKGSDKVWYICDAKTWRNATDIEKDTATWGAGAFEGEVRAGQVNSSIYYIYETDKKIWRNATTHEKDTYDYANNRDWPIGTDGEIKNGSVTDSIYVYDATAWRTADDVEKVLGGCVAAIADSVGKVGSTYYICTPRKWVGATVLQYDTYRKNCTEFGQIVHGNVNQEYAYFCYGNEWKRFLGNESISYGRLEDNRDGNIYRTVQIGRQIWMAENINYAGSETSAGLVGESWCYNNNAENCSMAGRLYSGDAANGVCPDGWRLPRKSEWHALFAAVGGQSIAGKVLKSAVNWNEDGNLVLSDNGIDTYGFSALSSRGSSIFVAGHISGSINSFWTSTRGYSSEQDFVTMNLDSDNIENMIEPTTMSAFPVRCISEQSEYSDTLKDSRDGQVYKTIIIGSQTWMAENLNYEMTDSYCYEDDENNCVKYGRLYTWSAAMESCPDGWHLPTNNNFSTLLKEVATMFVPSLLISVSGWESGGGKDTEGFSELPGGFRHESGGYSEDEAAYFWSSTDYGSSAGSFNSYNWDVHATADKNYGYSVRCIKE